MHPGYRVEELLVGQGDAGLRIGLMRHVHAHRPRDARQALNPPRRKSRAGTVGASSGDTARMSAAESSTASSEITHDEYGSGERNRTSGR